MLDATKEKEIATFQSRPGLGTNGKHVKVRTNFFGLKTFPKEFVVHYDVNIDNTDCPPKLGHRIFNQLRITHGANEFGGRPVVFDGRHNMFTSKPLPLGEGTTLDVTFDNERPRPGREPKVFKVKIKKVKEIHMSELTRFLNGTGSLNPDSLTAIMALDIIFRYKPSQQHETVGRSFYVPQNSVPIFGGLEIWQGYYQSCRPAYGRMLLNLDSSATAFYQSGSLIKFVCESLSRRSPDEFRGFLNNRDLQKLEKAVKGLTVVLTHRGERQRKIRIKSISKLPADKITFNTEQDGEHTVASYFAKRYKLRLNYPFLPCITDSKNSQFPIEVCNIVAGQRYLKKLNEKQTSDMIKFTCQQPQARAERINSGFNALEYHNNEYLEEFGISVDRNMIEVDGRVLRPPTLCYNKTSRSQPFFQPEFGSWNLKDKQFIQGERLNSWGVVSFANRLSERDVMNFVRELITVCSDTGMEVPNKYPLIMGCNPGGNIEAQLREVWLGTGNSARAKPQLLLVILPTTATSYYAEIKRVGDTVLGVATQCMQSMHAQKAKKMYCANLALKINAKLGGMNVHLRREDIEFVSQAPTIIIGADVTHPGPGDSTRPSIATLVGSMDALAARYSASIRIQAGRREVIVDLAGMMVEILKTFYQTCHQKPQRIIYYRDGVSDGQFSEVLSTELASLETACSRLEVGYRPTITFVIVKKRHHARFFPMDRRQADKSGNCSPGTVIESGITHPSEFDFYLQSHSGLLGTSRSTHYHVLKDENNFTADSLQMLTYSLCYMFVRCTKSVSIVPPIYYAHLVAIRARFHSRSGSWSEHTAEGSGTRSDDLSSYGTVKEELQQVMYYV